MKKQLSKSNQAVLLAVHRGYRVTEEGRLLSPTSVSLKGRLSPAGYWSFNITDTANGLVKFPVYVHRLQAFQKYGEIIFNPGTQVRHLDGNPQNNSVSNIAIGTQSQNRQDVPLEIRMKVAKLGGRCRRCLSDLQLMQFRVDRENGLSLKRLAIKFGIAKSTASYIVNRRTYRE